MKQIICFLVRTRKRPLVAGLPLLLGVGPYVHDVVDEYGLGLPRLLYEFGKVLFGRLLIGA